MPVWNVRTRQDRLNDLLESFRLDMEMEEQMGPAPFPKTYGDPHKVKYEKLLALSQDPDFDKIDEFLAGRNTTQLICDRCSYDSRPEFGRHSKVVLLVDDEDCNMTYQLCGECLTGAAKALEESPPDHARVPFSPQQVSAINAYQESGRLHPLTCGNDSGHSLLVAKPEGLRCPDCDYEQSWIHDGIANGSW